MRIAIFGADIADSAPRPDRIRHEAFQERFSPSCLFHANTTDPSCLPMQSTCDACCIFASLVSHLPPATRPRRAPPRVHCDPILLSNTPPSIAPTHLKVQYLPCQMVIT
eukprot:3128255-Rhodomonas_salina.1